MDLKEKNTQTNVNKRKQIKKQSKYVDFMLKLEYYVNIINVNVLSNRSCLLIRS